MGGLTRPTLTTERLRLEPLTTVHTDLLVELDSDPLVLRHVFGRALSREEVVREWMPKRTRLDAEARGLGYWVGFMGEDFAGWWCLGLDDQDENAGELGYRLPQAAWGRGLATEGAAALLEHAFRTVGPRRVWAETMVVNTGSQRVMQKLGLTRARSYVGEWDDPLAGWEQGEVVYEITASSTAGSACHAHGRGAPGRAASSSRAMIERRARS